METTLKNAPAQVLNKDGNGVCQSLVLQTANEAKQALTKNQVFKKLYIELCPLKFDDSKVREFIAMAVSARIDGFCPLKDSQTGEEIESENDCIERLIDERRNSFYANNSYELSKFESTPFEELCSMIANSTLADDVKRVVGWIPTPDMVDRYFDDGKVKIYRSEQSTTKDGTNKYQEGLLKRESELTGDSFSYSFFFELREYSVTNVLLAIRFYSNFESVRKNLSNDIKAAEKPFEELKRAFIMCTHVSDLNPYKVLNYLHGISTPSWSPARFAEMFDKGNFELEDDEK